MPSILPTIRSAFLTHAEVCPGRRFIQTAARADRSSAITSRDETDSQGHGRERKMIHNLTAGHFGNDGAVTKPLDMRIIRRLLDELGEVDADGTPTLGGWKVRSRRASDSAVERGRGANLVAEEFAARLQHETCCVLEEREHGRVFQGGQLAARAVAARRGLCETKQGLARLATGAKNDETASRHSQLSGDY